MVDYVIVILQRLLISRYNFPVFETAYCPAGKIPE